MTDAAPETDAIPGYDRPVVEAWLAAHCPEISGPFDWVRLPGGHSNLTWRLTDSTGRQAVIRRPPLGELLPKAHDMGREFRVLSALKDTPVPTPRPLAYCEDPSVTGAHFYVMDFLDGHPLYTADDVRDWAPEAKRRDLAFAFIDALAQLHALDPAAVGLGDLGKPEGYVERQINAWGRSWTASVGPAGFDDPRAHEVEAFLRARLPGQVPARIVHGDFGIHNILVGRGGGLLAVIDWEIATLGDPLADLAYALNPWPDPSDPEPPVETAPHAQPGFPTRTELAERYAAATGADLSGLNYYVAFNRWKSACIVHGVYARYMEGKKSTEGVDTEGLRLSVLRSLELAARAAAAD